MSDDIFDWRFEQLLRVGFAHDAAWRLASDPQVDIRLAERLVAAGCPPATVQRILL